VQKPGSLPESGCGIPKATSLEVLAACGMQHAICPESSPKGCCAALLGTAATPPFTPRTYDEIKEKCSNTQAEIEESLLSIAQRRANFLAAAVAVETPCPHIDPESTPIMQRYDTNFFEDDVIEADSTYVDLAGLRSAQSRVAARVAKARTRTPRSDSPVVPLVRSPGGELVDVRALQQRQPTSALLCCRGEGGRLVREDIIRACKERTALRRPRSAPDFIRRNRSSGSLECRRPEVQRRMCSKRSLLRCIRTDNARGHRIDEAEALHVRSASAVSVARRRAPAAGRDASSAVPQTNAQIQHGTDNDPKKVERQLASLLVWLVAEAFLGSLRSAVTDKGPLKALRLWDIVVNSLRIKIVVKRWWRRVHAANILRVMLFRMSLYQEVLQGYRKRKRAATYSQRVWRAFNARIRLVAEDLFRSTWLKQEQSLLESVHKACPLEADVVVADPRLLCHEPRSPVKVPTQALAQPVSGQKPAALVQGRWKHASSKSPGVCAAKSIGRASKPAGRCKHAASKSPGCAAKSLGSASKSAGPQSMQLLRATSGIASMESFVPEQSFEELQKRWVHVHSFRREIALKLLRHEVVVRIYEHISVVRTSGRALGSTVAKPVNETARRKRESFGLPPSATALSDHEVAEIAFCAHYKLGVRPIQPGICRSIFRTCPAWRLNGVVGVLEGTQTIRAFLLDRWSRRRTLMRSAFAQHDRGIQLGSRRTKVFTQRRFMPRESHDSSSASLSSTGGTPHFVNLPVCFRLESESESSRSSDELDQKSCSRASNAPMSGRCGGGAACQAAALLADDDNAICVINDLGGSARESATCSSEQTRRFRRFDACLEGANEFCSYVLGEEDPSDVGVRFFSEACGDTSSLSSGAAVEEDLGLRRSLPALDVLGFPALVEADEVLPNRGESGVGPHTRKQTPAKPRWRK